MSTGTKARHEKHEIVARERPELLVFCGIAGIVGNMMPLVAIAAGTLLTQHDLVADTISDLARGERKWIMDVGFYFNAGGLLALAIAAAHAHLGRAGWTLGLFCLSFLALVEVLLGVWDEFGQQTPDMSVHTQLTFFLGPLYLAGPLAMAEGAKGVHRAYKPLFLSAAAVWLVFAVAFKLAPNSFDGLLEKIAVAGTLLWLVPLSWLFLARGRETLHRLTGD
ncbi:Protein of unknown function [Palleronia salina]|uniref:DUF998 domain-containing protein n=1 Tax=Palleronia salina TaxID=313368 RepID=A0A1M6G9H7_9RHOB|nr:DUF998 domain-containing protein [Palleronia salina]SHJ06645.1 Protein of unknown function [Palleronia salina]